MKTGIKWKAILGLATVYVALITNLWSLWGLVVLLWILPDLRRGSTHFLEVVNRQDNPILFWTMMLTWIALAVYMIAIDLSPRFGGLYLSY